MICKVIDGDRSCIVLVLVDDHENNGYGGWNWSSLCFVMDGEGNGNVYRLSWGMFHGCALVLLHHGVYADSWSCSA